MSVVMLLPSEYPIMASNMNYAVVILAVVILFALLKWSLPVVGGR